VEDEYENLDGQWLISRRTVSPIAGLTAVGEMPSSV
jgi:hypothetical protein